MRVLATGAGGFLANHVVSRLLSDGFDVAGFDLTPGIRDDVEWIEGDLRDLDGVKRAAIGNDAICHLGAIGDVDLAGEPPSLAAEVNVVGCANVAEAAQGTGAKVVYASTWEVYGEPQYEPIDEEHRCHPDHPYNITKLSFRQSAAPFSRPGMRCPYAFNVVEMD